MRRSLFSLLETRQIPCSIPAEVQLRVRGLPGGRRECGWMGGCAQDPDLCWWGLAPLGLSPPQDTEGADLGSVLEAPKQSASHLMQQARSDATKCLHLMPRELHG